MTLAVGGALNPKSTNLPSQIHDMTVRSAYNTNNKHTMFSTLFEGLSGVPLKSLLNKLFGTKIANQYNFGRKIANQ